MTSDRPDRVNAIERATGVQWEAWLEHFAKTRAAEKPHAEIVKIARNLMPGDLQNPEWWAQGVAIAFEHQVGLRVPGESSTGTFQMSVSRTVTGERDEVLAAWITHTSGRPHQSHELSNERTSRTDKRSYWRATLQGAGKLDVAVANKSDEKVLLTVQHLDLPSAADIDVWRSYWKSHLGAL